MLCFQLEVPCFFASIFSANNLKASFKSKGGDSVWNIAFLFPASHAHLEAGRWLDRFFSCVILRARTIRCFSFSGRKIRPSLLRVISSRGYRRMLGLSSIAPYESVGFCLRPSTYMPL